MGQKLDGLDGSSVVDGLGSNLMTAIFQASGTTDSLEQQF